MVCDCRLRGQGICVCLAVFPDCSMIFFKSLFFTFLTYLKYTLISSHSLSSPRPEPFLPGYLYFFSFSFLFLEYSKFLLAVSGMHTMYLSHTTPIFPSSRLPNITLFAFMVLFFNPKFRCGAIHWSLGNLLGNFTPPKNNCLCPASTFIAFFGFHITYSCLHDSGWGVWPEQAQLTSAYTTENICHVLTALVIGLLL